jgi:GT2 family glycosyltransferase
MYTEDFDLSYAAWKRGWKVTYEPRCVAYHRGSFSAQRAFGRRSRYLNQTRNCFLLVWKNVTDGMLLRRHLAWLPLRLATAPFCGRRMLAAAFLLALGRLGEALHRRRDVRWLATVPDRDIFDLFRPTAYDLAHSPYRGTAGTS